MFIFTIKNIFNLNFDQLQKIIYITKLRTVLILTGGQVIMYQIGGKSMFI